jgi:hypothetical protein
MVRPHCVRLFALIPLICVLLVLGLSALPSSTVYACLPCNCPEYRSVNCFGPYALYTPSDDEGCSIDIWLVEEDGQGERTLLQTPEDLATLPNFDEIDNFILVENANNGYVSLYKHADGRYQLNVGPTEEGKIYTTEFRGCPADDVHESTFAPSE